MLQSGSVKAYSLSEDGEHQISGFHFPGEWLGLDGVQLNRHMDTAEALENTNVCEIPFDEFDKLFSLHPSLRKKFYDTCGKQLTYEKRHIMVLGRLTAQQRLADFILTLADRLRERGMATDSIAFTMTRHDIGNHLSLAVETVSRLLGRFKDTGIISLRYRSLAILRPDLLHAIAHGQEEVDSTTRLQQTA